MQPSQPQAPPPFQDLPATVAQQRQSQSDKVARLDRWLLDMKGKRDDEMETLSRVQKRVADLDRAIASLEGKHKVAKQLLDELDEREDSLADKVLPVTHSSVWREAAAQATRPFEQGVSFFDGDVERGGRVCEHLQEPGRTRSVSGPKRLGFKVLTPSLSFAPRKGDFDIKVLTRSSLRLEKTRSGQQELRQLASMMAIIGTFLPGRCCWFRLLRRRQSSWQQNPVPQDGVSCNAWGD